MIKCKHYKANMSSSMVKIDVLLTYHFLLTWHCNLDAYKWRWVQTCGSLKHIKFDTWYSVELEAPGGGLNHTTQTKVKFDCLEFSIEYSCHWENLAFKTILRINKHTQTQNLKYHFCNGIIIWKCITQSKFKLVDQWDLLMI